MKLPDAAQMPESPIDGRYALVDEIGVGGMGRVYSAVDLQVASRPCAIKVLSATADTSVTRQRFEREVRLISSLNSPNIVAVDDAGHLADGRPYLVMELLEGRTLKSEISRLGRLQPGVALAVVDDVLAGLAVAHAAGVVHRDVKPGNIFLVNSRSQRSRAVLLDFGLARPHVVEDAGLTSQNMMVGSPPYMSPEQITQGELDGRSDLYGLGITLHIMLTGRHPFNLGAVPDKVKALSRRMRFVWCHLNQNIQLIDGISDELRHVAGRLRARRPELRYHSATNAMRALRQTPEGSRLGPIDPTVDQAVPATFPVRIDDLDIEGIIDDMRPSPTLGALPPISAPEPVSDRSSFPAGFVAMGVALAVLAIGGGLFWMLR